MSVEFNNIYVPVSEKFNGIRKFEVIIAHTSMAGSRHKYTTHDIRVASCKQDTNQLRFPTRDHEEVIAYREVDPSRANLEFINHQQAKLINELNEKLNQIREYAKSGLVSYNLLGDDYGAGRADQREVMSDYIMNIINGN